jgi:hypothetical protein
MFMDKWKILFVGLLSTWADAATTILGLHYPELKERNPLANPFIETAGVLGGQALILVGGQKLKVNPKVTHALALAATIPPFYAAANNLAHMAVLEAQTYPWKQCPLLYA